MNTKVFKMTKEMLMKGFKQSRFDILKTSPGSVSGGIYTSPKDRVKAYHAANVLLEKWKSIARQDKNLFPSDPSEIERYIDIELAELRFMEAQAMIGIPYPGQSNADWIKDAQEAIDILKRLGGEAAKKASNFEWILKERTSGQKR